MLVGEYNSAGTILSRNLPGPGGDEAALMYSGTGTATPQWLHADAQGSTIAWSNAAGVSLGTLAYDPYGQPSAWSGPRYAYTGQLMIPEARLYHDKARAYSPGLGRFLQTDPAGFAGGVNLYAYVGNDPVNGVDPSGMTADPNDTAPKTCVGGVCPGAPSVEQVVVTATRPAPTDPPQHVNPYNSDQTLAFNSVSPPQPQFGTEGGGGGKDQKPQSKGCTAAQAAATQMAKGFENASSASGWIAFGGGVGTVVSGAGEGVTLGGDTPVTITFGSITGFFGSASFGTGAAAAALNSFANGNLGSIRGFDWSQLTNLAATAAASKIPFVKPWAETIGDLAEQGADLAAHAREACR